MSLQQQAKQQQIPYAMRVAIYSGGKLIIFVRNMIICCDRVDDVIEYHYFLVLFGRRGMILLTYFWYSA